MRTMLLVCVALAAAPAALAQDDDVPDRTLVEILRPTRLGDALARARVRPYGWVRWDHSFEGPFFDDHEDQDQLSLTFDVVVTF